mgnify:CR=1 FL=1
MMLTELFWGFSQFFGKGTDKVRISLESNSFAHVFDSDTFFKQGTGQLQPVNGYIVADGETGMLLEKLAQPGPAEIECFGDFLQRQFSGVVLMDILQDLHHDLVSGSRFFLESGTGFVENAGKTQQQFSKKDVLLQIFSKYLGSNRQQPLPEMTDGEKFLMV